MTDPMPIVRYAAKSSPDEKGSTGDQLARIAEHIGADRFDFAGPFEEENVSGYKDDRGAELTAAIAASKRAADEHGEAELWVFHSSRLARGSGRKGEARSLGALFYELRAAGVTLRSVEDDDFVTREEFIGMAATQAHKYSADLSAHVRRGKDRQLREGERMGGPIPDGYTQDRDPKGRPVGPIYTDVGREPTLRRLWDLALEGLAPAQIAARLNGEGHSRDSGKPWDRRAVQDKLTNAHYAGAVVRHRGKPHEEINWDGKHPAYVTREQFEQVQTGMAARDRAKGTRPSGGRPSSRYLLQRGLAKCAECGETMYAVTSGYRRKDGTRARQYVCGNVKGSVKIGAKPACTAPPIAAAALDERLLDALPTLMFDFEQWTAGLTMERDAARKEAQDRLTVAMRQLEHADDRIGKIEDDYLRRIDHAQTDAADVCARALAKEKLRREAAEREIATRHAALQELLAEDTPHDAMLDTLNALRAAIRQRVEGTSEMKALHARLTELFVAFRLETREDGVAVWPIVRAEVWNALGVTGEAERQADGSVAVKRWVRPEVEPVETGRNSQEYRLTKPKRGALAASQP